MASTPTPESFSVRGEQKDMKKIVSLHQAFHLKDISSSTLQRICNETCRPVLPDRLGVDQVMIAYHRPLNLKDLVIPSSMKPCIESNLKASSHLINSTERSGAKKTVEKVKNIVEDNSVSAGMIMRLKETFDLVGHEINPSAYRKEFMFHPR